MGDHLRGVFKETFDLWMDMGIYLVFGFAVAGVLSRLLKRDAIVRYLGRNSMGSVAKATLFGIPLPLCSCGVIPVGLSLHNRGSSRGATTAFLISTPQTGVDSIAATWAFLGPVFALARPVAALLNGLLGGGAVMLFERNGGRESEGGSGAARVAESDCGECDEAERGNGRVSLAHHAVHALRYGFVDFPAEIVRWLLIGIVAAGVMAYLLPSEHEILQDYLGTGFAPMAVMAFAGIPLYICATASVPIVAVLVVKGGLSAGAALVFLMTGPATNVASLLLIARILGRRTAAIYLGSIVLTSFACGFALDMAYAASGSSLTVAARAYGEHEMLPAWLTVAGGIGLALIVAGGIGRNWTRARALRKAGLVAEAAAATGATSEALELRVEGMTCGGCAENVRKAATSVEGVEEARVNLKGGTVRVSGGSPDRDAVARAIESKGYRVVEGG